MHSREKYFKSIERGCVFFMVYQFKERRSYQYDYNWIDELSGAMDVLTENMVLPEFLVEELSSVSLHLSEIYIEACRWEERQS